MPQSFGRLLILVGLAIAALGVLLMLGGQNKWLRLGRLPGDIAYQKDGFSFFFPITTMILLSLLFTLAMWILRLFRR